MNAGETRKCTCGRVYRVDLGRCFLCGAVHSEPMEPSEPKPTAGSTTLFTVPTSWKGVVHSIEVVEAQEVVVGQELLRLDTSSEPDPLERFGRSFRRPYPPTERGSVDDPAGIPVQRRRQADSRRARFHRDAGGTCHHARDPERGARVDPARLSGRGSPSRSDFRWYCSTAPTG